MDIPSWCVVGAKVVAKDTISFKAPNYLATIVAGQTYTIRDVLNHHNGTGIRLVEVTNPVVRTYDAGMAEQMYHATMFAPLVDTKMEQDIAMFKDILLHADEYRDVTENA